MKSIKKIVALVLVVAMFLLSGCDSNKEVAKKANINLVSSNKFLCTVVVSADASEQELAIAQSVSDSIDKVYGKSEILKDTDLEDKYEGKIIVGNTCLEESESVLTLLTDNRKNNALDYIVAVKNGNIVINANNLSALNNAVEFFNQNIIEAKRKTLKSDFCYVYCPEVKSLTIADNSITDYSIVVSAENRDYYSDTIDLLNNFLRITFGYIPPVVQDSNEAIPEKAFFIGSKLSLETVNTEKNVCKIFENQGSIHIYSENKDLVVSGVEKFITDVAGEEGNTLKLKAGYNRTVKDKSLSTLEGNFDTNTDINSDKDDNTVDKDDSPNNKNDNVVDEPYKLVWSDEFNGTELNSDIWTPRQGVLDAYNGGKQYYTNSLENIWFKDGMLNLTGRWHETEENSFTSAYIKTEDKLTYRYGYVEISARLPKGNGVWPAFWALGTDPKGYQEIDFFEMFTNNSSQVVACAHKWWWNIDPEGNEVQQHSSIDEPFRYYDLPEGETFNDAFHTFGCEWTPEYIKYFVDGNCYYTYDISGEGQDLHHTPIYLILCLQIGIAGAAKGVDDNTPMPANYEIDYVRLYQRPSYSELNIVSNK